MSERISALMDGELEDDDALSLLANAPGREQLRDSWATYHLIGDALRQMPDLTRGVGADFHARLAAEPTVLVPRNSNVRSHSRKWLAWSAAAAAAVMAVALVVGTLVPSGGYLGGSMTVPRNAVVASAGNSQPDETLNSYLLAHQEYSASGVQGSPYVMRAAFDSGRDAAP